MCCYFCLSNFRCFKSCVWWIPFCVFCYVSHAVVSGTYRWVAWYPLPRLDQRSYHGCLSMMTSSEGSFFNLAWCHPNPKSTTAHLPSFWLHGASAHFCTPAVIHTTFTYLCTSDWNEVKENDSIRKYYGLQKTNMQKKSQVQSCSKFTRVVA